MNNRRSASVEPLHGRSEAPRRLASALGFAVALIALSTGCASVQDATPSPEFHGGYRPGQAYRLRVDLLLVERPAQARRLSRDVLYAVPLKDALFYSEAARVQALDRGAQLELQSIYLTASDPGEPLRAEPVAVLARTGEPLRVSLREVSTYFFYPERDVWLAFPNPVYLASSESPSPPHE